MAYSASSDRSDAIKSIFIRPTANQVSDEFDYGSSDLNIYPGMCVDLVNKSKFSSGHATNKGGNYEPQVVNYNYLAGADVLTEWPVSSKVLTKLDQPGALVAVRVGAGTTTNYAVGTELVGQAGETSTAVTGLTFKSGTLVAGTVCHFIVEEAPSADIATTGLILARQIPKRVLADLT